MITFTESQLVAWLSPILWPFLRVLAVFTTAPIFSIKSVPIRVRVGLAFFIAVAAQASLENQPVISMNGPEAMGAVVQQVGIGLAIGFAVRTMMAVFELAGEMVGLQMGLNFASFFDPTSNAQVSAMARFFAYMASLLFIVLNGHLMVLMAVIRSFEAFPVNQNFLEANKRLNLYQLGTDLFASALWMALPMVGMLIFVNLALGIVSRVAPQINIYSIGFPITILVGIIGVVVTLPMLDQPFMSLMERAIGLFLGR
ncbi:MAG: flagellar biosynthetic protein FliR [Gammaproteobacteria bacterium]|nr:flagellar biosynthetic protein FliR [Gammaproteobacteria bacterium]MBU0785882.1 flagellar biosynthetic protein FliR [Gammaproteobacteria bacterium]MBU0816495.1 flagellar biosynthetic protein FliR [Gammaproteobacteria bacterium]MBU1788296.1 flagellar biosynthetic protein FliR [Gammaproteobacteria bacterium]